MYSSVESDRENWDVPSPSVWQSLQSLARQLSPMLVPLPFAFLTFLFTLAAYAHNSAHLAPLPLGIILFALAIIQAISLYYASSNDTLWTLYTIGGYVLFLLVAAYATFGFVGSLILFIIVLLLAIVLGRRAVCLVPEGQVYIVMKFGKYSRTLFPGLNLLFPWEKVGQHLSTREFLWTSPPQRIQLSQETDVELSATFSYQLLQYAQSIAHNLIADVSKGFDQNSQLTIGIYGEWGSGKTSFLHMIEYYLDNDFGNHAIWFDAWKYDKEDNLWAALIQRILDQATENGKWYQRARVKFRSSSMASQQLRYHFECSGEYP